MSCTPVGLSVRSLKNLWQVSLSAVVSSSLLRPTVVDNWKRSLSQGRLSARGRPWRRMAFLEERTLRRRANSCRCFVPRAVTESGNSANPVLRDRVTDFTSTYVSGPAPLNRKSIRLFSPSQIHFLLVLRYYLILFLIRLMANKI